MKVVTPLLIMTLCTTLLMITACDTTTGSDTPPEVGTGKAFTDLSLSGTWQVSQGGTDQETDTVSGKSSENYPYNSSQWDTTFTFSSIFMRGDTLMIEGWKSTQISLRVNYWGVGTGNTIELTGTRMNGVTTPVSESYTLKALSLEDGTIKLILHSFMLLPVGSEGSSSHGYGEKSSATLSR